MALKWGKSLTGKWYEVSTETGHPEVPMRGIKLVARGKRPAQPEVPDVQPAPASQGVDTGKLSLDPTKVQEAMDAGMTKQQAIDKVAAETSVVPPAPAPQPAPGTRFTLRPDEVLTPRENLSVEFDWVILDNASGEVLRSDKPGYSQPLQNRTRGIN